MDNLSTTFSDIKSSNWNSSLVSFFIVKRKLVQRKAKYDVIQVNIDENFRKKLRDITVEKIKHSKAVIEYDFNTTDLDDNLLGLPIADTDLQFIMQELYGEEDPPFAENSNELFGAWFYIARFDIEGNLPLFSARRISEGWKAKKVFKIANLVFENNMLVDLSKQDVFRIDGNIDFFTYKDTILIADKKNFEIVLNFREGMEKNRDEIIKEFNTLGLFQNTPAMSKLVGNNLSRLRKLSQVRKAGYYKDTIFLERARIVSQEDGWGITFSEDGKILVTEDDIETVLRVLTNGRLTSKINAESFDVDVKHKIGSGI